MRSVRPPPVRRFAITGMAPISNRELRLTIIRHQYWQIASDSRITNREIGNVPATCQKSNCTLNLANRAVTIVVGTRH